MDAYYDDPYSQVVVKSCPAAQNGVLHGDSANVAVNRSSS